MDAFLARVVRECERQQKRREDARGEAAAKAADLMALPPPDPRELELRRQMREARQKLRDRGYGWVLEKKVRQHPTKGDM